MALAKATTRPVGVTHNRTYRAEGTALLAGYAVIQGTADDQAKLPAGAAAQCLGVVAEQGAGSAVDKPVDVVQFGETLGIAGGLVNAGNWVKCDASGKLVASAGEDTENVGRAISSAAADTDEFIVFVNPVKKRS